ncbi:RNA polymerase sigma-70 factor [Sphingobacterium bovisgrunnientis]|jgi:RNA polymerase sigma-70 factor (family 1)|uniref:RNA polymerase sigma-70 factor n=1 Tax=Sphingobacterium bovisgrunnientis TaxID=1874697 RepID=UPI00135A4662|nr:RNA polymerase sigma-70 factor [Sphingobacterium bovisgrunnientis]
MVALYKISDITEKEILNALKEGDHKVFSVVYDRYAEELLHFIYGFTKDKQICEDILHEIFMDFWRRKESIEIKSNLKSYLFSSAKYAVLTFIRSEKVRQKYVDHFNLFLSQLSTNETYEISDLNDLHCIISMCLEKLPNKCKEAFCMSRFQHKSIHEIAQEMNISPRTVENYITLGLKTIRTALANYSWLLIIFSSINKD